MSYCIFSVHKNEIKVVNIEGVSQVKIVKSTSCSKKMSINLVYRNRDFFIVVLLHGETCIVWS